MQNTTNLDNALLFSRNQVFCLKFENFDELQLSYNLIFFAETSLTFSTYYCLQEGVLDFFKFYLDVELFAKIKNDLVSTYPIFTFVLITQDLSKIKEIPHIIL